MKKYTTIISGLIIVLLASIVVVLFMIASIPFHIYRWLKGLKLFTLILFTMSLCSLNAQNSQFERGVNLFIGEQETRQFTKSDILHVEASFAIYTVSSFFQEGNSKYWNDKLSKKVWRGVRNSSIVGIVKEGFDLTRTDRTWNEKVNLMQKDLRLNAAGIITGVCVHFIVKGVMHVFWRMVGQEFRKNNHPRYYYDIDGFKERFSHE